MNHVHNRLRAALIVVLLFLYMPAASAQEYEDLVQVMRDYMAHTETLITSLDAAQSADQVTAAMRAYLEASRAYIGQMQALEEKYPELNDEVPATLENLLEELEEVMMRLQSSMMKLADYADDAELGKVMEEFQNLMM